MNTIPYKWEFDEKEKAFIDYCKGYGYKIVNCKQFISKTIFVFEIDGGIVKTYEVLSDDEGFDKNRLDKYMAQESC